MDDPRQVRKTEYRLEDILAIAVCAVLAGAESYEDIADYGDCKREWLGQFLSLPNGIPSHDTFRRVFMLIDAEHFEACFMGLPRRCCHVKFEPSFSS
ncbi:ISAs1 family transposase [Polycladidibacter stylochi]|uniref:ISAs1 family transposase n=1 Tax=Polycladidibacter stylochi TaxID=1807766 RepID=UPI0019D35614|nr:ISAs1 family transposase [Pseudovibrio stylochi]